MAFFDLRNERFTPFFIFIFIYFFKKKSRKA